MWNEHRESTRGRDLDITGLSYALLERRRRASGRCQGEAHRPLRLYEDGVFPTADGKATLRRHRLQAGGRSSRVALPVLAQHRPPARPVARHEPHRHAGRLFGHVPGTGMVQMHRRTWRAANSEGDLVHVTSKRGSIVVPVQASADMGLSRPSSPCTGARNT
jgi:assimilatory nitrate reductase catalytic subunit